MRAKFNWVPAFHFCLTTATSTLPTAADQNVSVFQKTLQWNKTERLFLFGSSSWSLLRPQTFTNQASNDSYLILLQFLDSFRVCPFQGLGTLCPQPALSVLPSTFPEG